MDTLFDLPESDTPEHAVIAHFCLSDDEYGTRAEHEAIWSVLAPG